MKKTVVLGLCLIGICMLCALGINRDDDGSYFIVDDDGFAIEIVNGDCNEIIRPFVMDWKFYYFLPSFANDKVNCGKLDPVEEIALDHVLLSCDESIRLEYDREYTLSYRGIDFQVVFMKADNIGSIFIETESGSMDDIYADKAHVEAGLIDVFDEDAHCYYSGGLSISGRGNSTWSGDKKPFDIKLASSSSLLGMGGDRRWVLLSNRLDSCYMHNMLAYEMSDYVGLDYTPDARYVDLYCNGTYWGLYLLAEKVNVGSRRVNITDLDAANKVANFGIDIRESQQYNCDGRHGVILKNNPDDISGGYLLERNFRRLSPESVRLNKNLASWIETKDGSPLTIKSPQYASREETDYIADKIQHMEEAIIARDGYSQEDIYYTDYIDISSWAKWYMTSEIVLNQDLGETSTYLYKDSDKVSDKIYMGPVWDFDNCWDGNIAGDVNSYVTANYRVGVQWFTYLRYKREFCAAIKEYWPKYRHYLVDMAPGRLELWKDTIEPSVNMDVIRWKDGYYEYSHGLYSQIDDLMEYIAKRVAFLDRCWGE